MLKKIDKTEEFEEILASTEKFFLLKHSLTCPISQAAYQEYEKFTMENQDIPAYFLAVQDSRPLSNGISEKFHIRHESPQALLFSNGKAIWNASHWKITNRSMGTAFKENQ